MRGISSSTLVLPDVKLGFPVPIMKVQFITVIIWIVGRIVVVVIAKYWDLIYPESYDEVN